MINLIHNVQETALRRLGNEHGAEAALRDTAAKLATAYRAFQGRVVEAELRSRAASMRTLLHDIPPSHVRIFRHEPYEFERLADEVETFRSRLVPRPFYVMIFLLAWLSGVGVLWPLTALPGLHHHPPSLMLGAVALGLVGMLLYMAYQLWELRRLGDVHWLAESEFEI